MAGKTEKADGPFLWACSRTIPARGLFKGEQNASRWYGAVIEDTEGERLLILALNEEKERERFLFPFEE